MANFDDMKVAVEALSGGKNTVILDDQEMPSVMVAFPKFKMSEVIDGGSENVHPAFMVGGVEKEVIYVSKFQNIVMNDRAYSLPFKDPGVSVNFDQALSKCRNKGEGWGLMPYSVWSAIALWCRKNGTMPRGNNQNGCDVSYKHEKGVQTSTDGGKTGRIATGSGPATWNHNWLPDGIADLNGNVSEWTAGFRTVNGELQIIPYANCMQSSVSMAAGSTEWKAISKDGTLVTPGTDGTLKWTTSGGKIQLTAGSITPVDQGNWLPYNNMLLDSSVSSVPELAKALLMYPDEPNGDYGGDYHGINTSGERLARCGGDWGNGASAGVFRVYLGDPRSYSAWHLGFRSAFVN